MEIDQSIDVVSMPSIFQWDFLFSQLGHLRIQAL